MNRKSAAILLCLGLAIVATSTLVGGELGFWLRVHDYGGTYDNEGFGLDELVSGPIPQMLGTLLTIVGGYFLLTQQDRAPRQ